MPAIVRAGTDSDVEGGPPASTGFGRQNPHAGRFAVKYLILIHSNAGEWDALPEARRAEFRRAHAALRDALADSGELVVSQALADPSTGRRVSVRDGQTITSDGPFAEAKEHLAGFYLVECESLERAIEHAARVPDAVLGNVEVRPVLTVNGSLDI
jgi:hypothetical protein